MKNWLCHSKRGFLDLPNHPGYHTKFPAYIKFLNFSLPLTMLVSMHTQTPTPPSLLDKFLFL